jgi:biotin carboxyl carrier protein
MKKFKFRIKGHLYNVEILNFEDNKAKVEVNGTFYKIELEQTTQQNKTPILVRKELETPRSAHKFKKQVVGTAKIKAPLPGNIMQIFVKEGDTIEKGQKLLQYEAMKMENDLLSEKQGVIKSIKVNPGDAVLEGDVLIEIL